MEPTLRSATPEELAVHAAVSREESRGEDKLTLEEYVRTLSPAPEASPWNTQVDGNHYSTMAIQPFEYSMRNGLDPMQHTIIKYVSRFRDKNGVRDLLKARHTIDLLIAFEESK